MRNNLPITQREVVMGDTMMIVSKTDLKGRIEFINEDFLEIAQSMQTAAQGKQTISANLQEVISRNHSFWNDDNLVTG